jgi:TM2 domain-containing membrane protein YozV
MSETFSLDKQPQPKAGGFGLLIAPLILSAIGAVLSILSVLQGLSTILNIFVDPEPFASLFFVLQGLGAIVFLLAIVANSVPALRKFSLFAVLLAEFILLVGYVFLNVDSFHYGNNFYFPVFSPLSWGASFYLVTDLPFYLNIASIVFAGMYVSKNRSKARALAGDALSPAAPLLNNPLPIANVASATTADAANQSSTPSAQQWEVQLPGAQGYSIDSNALLTYVNAGSIKADTLVKDLNSGTVYQAKQIPGLFSTKSWLTALLLSIFLGQLGIDRFYTGHIGLGIGKLLTLGGFGVWTLVDIILFATKSVKDPQGKVLA